MDFGVLLDVLDKHGPHALMLAMIVQLYLFGKELKASHKELRQHRQDEEETRKELIKVGTAVALLLERDRDRFVREEISGVHSAAVVQAAIGTEDPTPVDMPPPGKHRTPPGGYRVIKGKSDKPDKPGGES